MTDWNTPVRVAFTFIPLLLFIVGIGLAFIPREKMSKSYELSELVRRKASMASPNSYRQGP
jgi:glucose uptake protein GlcU